MRLGARYRKLIIAMFFTGAFLLLCINSLLIWVVTGPRSLAFMTPYIESALSPTDHSYSVKIGGSFLEWDGWARPMAIHVRDVKVRNAKELPVASFPEIGVHINLFRLLLGRLDIKRVEIINPIVVLTQTEEGAFYLGFGDAPLQSDAGGGATTVAASDNSVAEALVLFSTSSDDSPVTRLKSVAIEHARIAIKNARSGVFFQSQDASLELHRGNGQAKGTLILPIWFGSKAGKLQAGIVVDGEGKTIVANTSFSNVPSALLRELFPLQGWLKAANMPLAGKAELHADFNGHVASLAFNADAGEGVIEYPQEFEGQLAISSIHMEGEILNRLRELNLKKAEIDFGKFVLGLEGKFHREGDDYSVDAHIHTAHLLTDELKNYWPKSLSPHTRSWVMERISKGEVKNADVELHFKPGELKLKETPRDAVAAVLDVEGLSVLYMPKEPPVTDVNGRIEFTGNSMEATVASAAYLTNSKVTSAKIRFPDLNAADVKVFLDMNVTAPAVDVQTFLASPSMDKARKLHVTPEITGNTYGNAKLDFVAFSEHEEEKQGVPDINYELSATLDDVSQPDFLGKYDVQNANMQVKVNNKGLQASGKAQVKQIPMEIKAESLFNKSHDTSYAVKVKLPVIRMPDFGLPQLSWLKGSMGVDAHFVSSDAKDTAKAVLDLTTTDINLPEHGYIKKEGEPATLEIATQHLPSGNTDIPHFYLAGKNYQAQGKAEISKVLGGFKTLSFNKLTIAKHNLSQLDYARTPAGIKIVARGSVLDISPYMANLNKRQDSEGIEADIDVGKVVVADKRELFDVKAQFNCPDTCHSATASAVLSDKTPVSYSIHDGQLKSTCTNAGELLHALNVYDSMEGGSLLLKGGYQGNKIVGVATVKDFTIKNTPVLTRLLTIASLTGILDTLVGNGVAFDKMSAPYEYGQGNIVIKDAKQYGSALGITASGLISLSNASYDVSGTLVPSYTMNSLVGKIPLLGDIIVGEKGSGLIALTYTIKGPMESPSISANPLSVLTPGFLRGVFEIFDKPAPSLEEINAAQQKAAVKSSNMIEEKN